MRPRRLRMNSRWLSGQLNSSSGPRGTESGGVVQMRRVAAQKLDARPAQLDFVRQLRDVVEARNELAQIEVGLVDGSMIDTDDPARPVDRPVELDQRPREVRADVVVQRPNVSMLLEPAVEDRVVVEREEDHLVRRTEHAVDQAVVVHRMGGVVLAHLVEQVLQVERDRAVAPAVVGRGRAQDLIAQIRLEADRAGRVATRRSGASVWASG